MPTTDFSVPQQETYLSRKSGTQSSCFKSGYKIGKKHTLRTSVHTEELGEWKGEEVERLSLEQEPQGFSHFLSRGPCLGVKVPLLSLECGWQF